LSNLSTDPNAGLALTAPTGTVTIYDGATQVGQASLTATGKSGSELLTIPLAQLSPGVHTLNARYSGDSNYSAITFGNYSLVVGGGTATSTNVSVAPLSPVAGFPATFSATVSGGAPTGTVTFSAGSLNIGSAPLVNGVATLTSNVLTGATYSVIATYSGDAISTSSISLPLSVTVSKDTPAIAVTATPNPTGPTQAVTLVAQINPSSGNILLPSGTVKFFDGSTLLGTVNVADGLAALTTTFAAGIHSITATYSGDVDFATATSSAATVTATVTSTTTAVLCPAATYDGNSHSCTATAVGSDGKTVNGTTSFTYAGNAAAPSAAGTYQVNASFTSSDPAYGNSTAASSLTIAKATPLVAVTCPSVTADGNSHACTATATGVASVAVNGTMSITYNGVATAPSAAGTYAAAASFVSSNANYTNASGNGSLTIAAPAPNLVPVITSLNPPLAPANTAITLTVNGANFVPSSVVQWNGVARSTTFVSGTQLTASITYVDTQSVGTADVSVFTPAPGGGSASMKFAIDTATNTVGAVTVTSPNPSLTIARGQSASLQLATSQQVATSGTATNQTLSATCVNLPAGVSCGAFNSSNNTVPIAVSSSSLPGTYQFTVIFGTTQQIAARAHANTMLACWTGLLGMPFAMMWIGSGKKRSALRKLLLAVFAMLLLVSLSGCGGSSSTKASTANTVSSQSSVAVTLTIN
jgi:hypothetical protein